MDVHAERGNERMLRRVIALLVALATLAERVSDRAAPVRFFVLWILRRAETVAADFVFEETGIPPAAFEGLEGIAAVGKGRENALCLAARFRALAAVLRALLPLDRRFLCRPVRPGFMFGDAGPGSGHGPGFWALKPFDTS